MNRFFLALITAAFVLVPAAVSADSVGDTERFTTDREYDVSGALSVSGTLRHVGTSAYWYVDDRYFNRLTSAERGLFMADLDRLASVFDLVIYPRSRELWGTENIPGVDGDTRVTVFLEELGPGIGGYFNGRHSYDRSRTDDSNEREMFYAAVQSVGGNAKDYIAHEFQHLISFNRKELSLRVSDDVWLNEVRSEYNVTHTGQNDTYRGSALQRRVLHFLQESSDSLVDWPNVAVDYAIAAVFGEYFVEQYSPELLAGTIRTRNAGAWSLEEVLQGGGDGRLFPDVFNDWMVAVSLNDSSSDRRFGFADNDLGMIRVGATADLRLRSEGARGTSVDLQEWQPYWLDLSVPDSSAGHLRVSLAGEAGTSWVASLIAEYLDGSSRVVQSRFGADEHVMSVPLAGTARLRSARLALAHGLTTPVRERDILVRGIAVSASVGGEAEPAGITPPGSGSPADGDLISYDGAPGDVYVVWGPYRRYLPPGVLELYGFQSRPVLRVSSEKFFSYKTSNYIRTINDERVFAVRPEGTKHWLNMTEGVFLGSGRDPGAIFTVNEAESAFYRTGVDITR
ncbi:MAG TPA: hypothetical protein VD862_03360 [Candidatus Paceibacterota bacterium]|nr:hypothetical protein [Candidatus Paceibacterota bacterium]